MKALKIVDDRRCVFCGDLFSECDCFDDTHYFHSRSDASESEPAMALPTERHGSF